MTSAVQPGRLGDLFWRVDDPVVLFEAGRPVAWNPAAESHFGVSAAVALAPDFDIGSVLGAALPELERLVSSGSGSARLDCAGGCGLALDALVWELTAGGTVVALLRDVTARERLTRGMARLSQVGRELLGSEPSLPDLLQRLADEAKAITGSAFSAVLLVRPGTQTEVTHFAYNAPRELFPERLPRAVGLLEVALNAPGPVRLADIRGAQGGVGIPVKHPPIAALLAAPVYAGDQLLGLVAVANTPGEREFDLSDEALVVDLAAHAGTGVRLAQARALAALQAERRRDTIDAARHDVRNPLAAGKGYARMLTTKADRMTDTMKAEAYEHVLRVFERIEEFTERLLLSDDALPPNGQPRWEDVPLAELLSRIEADHAAAAQPGDGPLVIEVQPETKGTFRADPSLAREALDNLIGNAFKHGASGSAVTVTVRPEGGQVRFDVHNFGEGIPADEQTKVFDRYWRPDRVRGAGVAGSGLGLAIVRDIAAAHGGIIGVSSRPDEGTTFWVTFPAC